MLMLGRLPFVAVETLTGIARKLPFIDMLCLSMSIRALGVLYGEWLGDYSFKFYVYPSML
jgi:hypothetical protein